MFAKIKNCYLGIKKKITKRDALMFLFFHKLEQNKNQF